MPRPKYYWSGKNGDQLRTGATAFLTPSRLDAGPAWSWHEPGNGLIRAAPLIDGNMGIYLASIRGNVYKFNRDGQVVWTHSAGSSIPDVPALDQGSLFAADAKGYVFALDQETGAVRWRKKAAPASATDTWSMTAGEGIVVAAMSENGRMNDQLVALNATTGESLWSFDTDKPVYNSLSVIRNGSLVFSDYTGTLYRLNLATGEKIWKVPPSGKDFHDVRPAFSTGGAIVGPNGIIYVTSNAVSKVTGRKSGFVTAFSFIDGRRVWRKAVDYEANNAAAVGRLGPGGPLAVVIGIGENPDLPNPAMQMLGMTSSHVKKARVLALDAVTGTVIWRLEMPAWQGWAAGDTLSHICLPDSFGNPAISGDGTVYIGYQNGHLYAINDHDHDGKIERHEVSTFDAHSAFQGSPALAPGLLVTTPCDGIHVFKPRMAKPTGL